jgi:hypothetical protein
LFELSKCNACYTVAAGRLGRARAPVDDHAPRPLDRWHTIYLLLIYNSLRLHALSSDKRVAVLQSKTEIMHEYRLIILTHKIISERIPLLRLSLVKITAINDEQQLVHGEVGFAP